MKQAGASAAARAKRRGLENGMADHLAALAERGQADEAVAVRARAELPDVEYAAFQAGQIRARERHATRAEYAFMTADEIEADIAQQSPGGGPRDTDERAAAHAIRAETRDEVLAARAEDPAGWAMRDEAVAAAFAAAQENPDDPALARQATEQRLALQREMGIEEPRLLSEAEREEIAGQLAQAAPADRPALIAELRGRYGPHAGMLAAELAGEVDANTALLLDHADMPHLPRLLAQGMAKSAKDGPATLTLASPGDIERLPALPIIAKGEQGGRKLDMSSMKPGQHYRTADGGVMLYDGEALVPATVELATPNPADPNAPTPPLPLGKASPERETAVKGIAYEPGEQDEAVAVDTGDGRPEGGGIVDLEEENPSLPTGPEDEETVLEPAGPFEGFTRKKQQAFNGIFIIHQVDEIEKAEASQRGERTDLLETPRQQEQNRDAPPTGQPDIADMTEEEWQARKAELKHRLGKRVESFSQNYRELRKEFGSVDIWDDPEYATLHALGKAGEKGVEGAPVFPEQYRLLVRALTEHGIDPGDPEAVMDALYDEEFRALLNERRNEWAGNTAVNAGLKEKMDIGYEGGKQQPLETGEERVRPQGAKAQMRRVEDKLANAGYATKVDNIMMEIYTLRSIEQGARPDQMMTPRQAEQHRDRLPGDETALDRYAASLDDERAAMKTQSEEELADGEDRPGKGLPPRLAQQERDQPDAGDPRPERDAPVQDAESAAMKAELDNEIVDRLAVALEKQGKIRDRLKASEAQPGLIDDPLAAAARIGGDALLAVPGMIPGVAQIIGANESFYKTIGEAGVDTKDYRAMAELAVTEKFAEKWKANYDKYMVGIPVDMAKDYLWNLGSGVAKDVIKIPN